MEFTDPSSTIGIAGTGRMGTALATRLLGLGHSVVVWNRTAEKTEKLAGAGAGVATSPSELASAAEIVLTSLSDSGALVSTYSGVNGLLVGDVAGHLFIEMSTLQPADVQALAIEVRSKGAALIDCPVGGSVGPALEGRLFGFVGGEMSDVIRARPLLDRLCRRVEHLGPVGAGSRMKLAIQLPLHVYWQTLGEALAICEPLGLDPARLVDILADTPGASNVLKERGGIITSALRGEPTGQPAFDIDAVRKDLRSMVAEAQALGRCSPMAEVALETFDEVAREGLGGENAAVLTRRWVERGAAR